MNVAILGGTSNIVNPDTQIKLNKGDKIIIDGYGPAIDESETDVAPYIERWADKHFIPVTIMSYRSEKYKGVNKNDSWTATEKWYKDIVHHSDKIYFYCDEDHIYSKSHLFLLGYAIYLDKPVEIIKLKPMHLFVFVLDRSDDRRSHHYFTIRIDKKIKYDIAKEKAIEQAWIEFENFDKLYPHNLYDTIRILTPCQDGRKYWFTV